jgi:hypothetical protein
MGTGLGLLASAVGVVEDGEDFEAAARREKAQSVFIDRSLAALGA